MKKILSLTAIVFAIALFANNANADSKVTLGDGTTITTDGNERVKIKKGKNGKVKVTTKKDRSVLDTLVSTEQKDKKTNK